MNRAKPVCVLISDVHYNLNTIALADAAMRQAIDCANELKVPLVVAGDLHDSKANMRAECVNAMLDTIKLCLTRPYILRGNHDQINEKSEDHALNFLMAYATIVDFPQYIPRLNLHMIPYQHNMETFLGSLPAKPKGPIIAHQGIAGSNSGDYIQDKSAVRQEYLAGLRIISGHYHTRQTIQLPDNGIWDFVGNPYTLNYAEASDPPKGYQILYSDGNLEFRSTNLRRHVVLEGNYDSYNTLNLPSSEDICTGDLVWVKISGTKEQLAKKMSQKETIKHFLRLPASFRLDLILTDTVTQADTSLNLAEGPLLDSLIDSLSATSNERKGRLKDLWKVLK